MKTKHKRNKVNAYLYSNIYLCKQENEIMQILNFHAKC